MTIVLHTCRQTMIKLETPKYGRPGDLFLATPPAIIAVSALDKPETRTGVITYSVGLALDQTDMREVAEAMRGAFRKAFPDAAGAMKLPFRQNRQGAWLLFAETTRSPIILDGKGDPVPVPPVGAVVTVNARIAPYRRTDTGRQGVNLLLNRIRVPRANVVNTVAA